VPMKSSEDVIMVVLCGSDATWIVSLAIWDGMSVDPLLWF